jgi:hypothetical protein
MKLLFSFLSIFFLTSFTYTNNDGILQNGHYTVLLDKKYKDLGLNDFDFTIKDQFFIIKIANKLENLEIKWFDENSFSVIGYTEPLNPIELEKQIMQDYKILFRVNKQTDNKYSFVLGDETNLNPVFTGTIIKVE